MLAAEFVVELARSGAAITVRDDQSILEALIEAGYRPNHNCRQGICGTCETRVLEGEPDHRDLLLTSEEKSEGLMLICCSRAKTPSLTLDL